MVSFFRLMLPSALQRSLWDGEKMEWTSRLSPDEVIMRLSQVERHWEPSMQVKVKATGNGSRIHLECLKNSSCAWNSSNDPVFRGLLQPASLDGGSLVTGRFGPKHSTRWIFGSILAISGLVGLVFIWTVFVPLVLAMQIWVLGYVMGLMGLEKEREAEIRRCLDQVCQRHGWRNQS